MPASACSTWPAVRCLGRPTSARPACRQRRCFSPRAAVASPRRGGSHCSSIQWKPRQSARSRGRCRSCGRAACSVDAAPRQDACRRRGIDDGRKPPSNAYAITWSAFYLRTEALLNVLYSVVQALAAGSSANAFALATCVLACKRERERERERSLSQWKARRRVDRRQEHRVDTFRALQYMSLTVLVLTGLSRWECRFGHWDLIAQNQTKSWGTASSLKIHRPSF